MDKKQTGNKSREDEIEKLKKQADGHRADAEGLRYEQVVHNYFARQGWDILQWRKRLSCGEIDLYGESAGFFTVKYLLVECKKKERVSAADVARFIMKVNSFHRRNPDVEAYFCYSEEIDRTAVLASKGNNPPITFKKIAK